MTIELCDSESKTTQLYYSEFKGLKSVVLENAGLRAEWIPSYGGKMVSLRTKKPPQVHELLYQSPLRSLIRPHFEADFASFDTSGFDECFPSIDNCEVTVTKNNNLESVTVPDHGEVWSLPWQLEVKSHNQLQFSISSPLMQYRLTKTITLERDEIIMNYDLHLTGDITKMPFLWTPHALFSYQRDTSLIIPDHLNAIRSVCSVGRLEDQERLYEYPKMNDSKVGSWDASTFDDKDEGLCEKFYFSRQLRSYDWFGFCDDRGTVLMNVDANIVPYLGIWKNQGAHNATHNFALEPCSGIYDSAENAQLNGTVAYVTKEKNVQWFLKIKVT